MIDFFTTIIASIGGAGLITFILIKFFGNKIVNHIFQEKIESFKYKINLEFDRISKINQKEFEVLPTLWNLLIKHKKNLDLYTIDFRTDLNTMNEEEINKFIGFLPYETHLKEYILKSQDRDKAYKDIILNNGKLILQQSYLKFIDFYEDNKIFLTDEITTKSDEICEFIKSTLTVYELFIGPQTKNVRDAARNDFKRNFEILTSDLGLLIKNRLKFPKD